MDAVNLGERTLTGIDFDRLRQLREVQSSFEFSTLLDRAEVVEPSLVPRDIVTMYAQVDLQDVATGRRHRFVLCYPGQTEPREGFISVLSPVGVALIGLRVGAVARWRSASGQPCNARVTAVSRIAQFSA
jgi:regulator of nucleoside diphosphate kinase